MSLPAESRVGFTLKTATGKPVTGYSVVGNSVTSVTLGKKGSRGYLFSEKDLRTLAKDHAGFEKMTLSELCERIVGEHFDLLLICEKHVLEKQKNT